VLDVNNADISTTHGLGLAGPGEAARKTTLMTGCGRVRASRPTANEKAPAGHPGWISEKHADANSGTAEDRSGVIDHNASPIPTVADLPAPIRFTKSTRSQQNLEQTLVRHCRRYREPGDYKSRKTFTSPSSRNVATRVSTSLSSFWRPRYVRICVDTSSIGASSPPRRSSSRMMW